MKKIIIIFLVIFTNAVYSQWVQMSDGIGTNQTINTFSSNANNIFAGTWSNVYLSTNNGTNWSLISILQSIETIIIQGNNIFAGTLGSSGGVYISTNNGINWIKTALDNQWVYSLLAIGNNIFAGVSNNGVYVTTNNGTNWTQTSLNNKSVNALTMNGSTIFAGTGSSGVYLSTNNGVSWMQTSLNNIDINSLITIGNNIFAGTLNGDYLSTNNGTSWIQKNQGFSVIPIVYALLITNGYIFAGTINQSIWRRIYSETIGIKNISSVIPSSFSLSQNYPNPFNPSTIIKFQVPKIENGRMENSVINLKVFDLLGREIATLVNEKLQPGIYEVPFFISQYSDKQITSGVYFYRLSAGNYTETKKMILMK